MKPYLTFTITLLLLLALFLCPWAVGACAFGDVCIGGVGCSSGESERHLGEKMTVEGSRAVGAPEKECVLCGTFYDYRNGELLLGRFNLHLASGALVYCEGRLISADKMNGLARKWLACAHLNGKGEVSKLHLRADRFEHRTTQKAAYLHFGPQGESLPGQPIFVQYYFPEGCKVKPGSERRYLSGAEGWDDLRLFVDGKKVESGQVKQEGLLYYLPAEPLLPGFHRFRVGTSTGNAGTILIEQEARWTDDVPVAGGEAEK